MAGESLKIVAGNAAGSSIALDAELVIGRSTPGLGSLGGDSEISRVHARVFQGPAGLTVEDLGSTNGTFVNGNRITGAQPVHSGDQVRVGQTTMTVEGGAADGATAIGAIIPPAAAAVPPPPAAIASSPPTAPFQPAQPPPAYAQQPPPGPAPGYAGGPIGGPPQRVGGSSKAPWYALAAVVLIALIVGGLAIGGVFGGKDDKKSTAIAPVSTVFNNTTPTTPAAPAATPPPAAAMPAPPPSTPSTPSSGYPPGFVSKLVDSCASGGKLSRSQCQCWFGKLKNAYTFPQLINVLRKAKSGTIPPKAVSLLRGCLQS